jgi:phosphinothricin acetyltransferase
VVRVRDATVDDVAAINRLYNALVDTTTVAWTEAHEDVATRWEWLDHQGRDGNPVLVAEDDDAAVIGFASYDDFRDSVKWPGYRFIVEHTVHVDGRCHGQGVGRALMEELRRRAVTAGKHSMIGAVDADNDGSIRFHQRLGFTEVARVPQAGFKFGRWLDLVLLQRFVGDAP